MTAISPTQAPAAEASNLIPLADRYTLRPGINHVNVLYDKRYKGGIIVKVLSGPDPSVWKVRQQIPTVSDPTVVGFPVRNKLEGVEVGTSGVSGRTLADLLLKEDASDPDLIHPFPFGLSPLHLHHEDITILHFDLRPLCFANTTWVHGDEFKKIVFQGIANVGFEFYPGSRGGAGQRPGIRPFARDREALGCIQLCTDTDRARCNDVSFVCPDQIWTLACLFRELKAVFLILGPYEASELSSLGPFAEPRGGPPDFRSADCDYFEISLQMAIGFGFEHLTRTINYLQMRSTSSFGPQPARRDRWEGPSSDPIKIKVLLAKPRNMRED